MRAILLFFTGLAGCCFGAERITVAVDLDTERCAEAIRRAEHWDGISVGGSGELGPSQFLPRVWRMFSRRPLFWAIATTPECVAEQRRVARAEVEWIRARLSGLGLSESAWAVGLVHNAGYGHVRAGRVLARQRDFAARVQNLYVEAAK